MTARPPRRAAALVLLALCVSLAAFAGAGSSGVASPRVRAEVDESADAARGSPIFAAYTILLDQFYQPPDPGALLHAAWEGAVMALVRAGYQQDPPPAPAIPDDRVGGWIAFATAYPSLVAVAPPDLDGATLAIAAIDAMAVSLSEPNTALLLPATRDALMALLSDDPTGRGVGAMIASLPPWVVTEVAPGGPAERAGLLGGDEIVAIDQVDVTRGGRDQFDRAIGGADGTPARITFERPGAGRLVTDVTRGPFQFPYLQSRVLADGSGYVRLRSFPTYLAREDRRPTMIDALDGSLAAFERQGVTRWILDLRDNPGGDFRTLNAVIGRFLPGKATHVLTDARGNRGEVVAPIAAPAARIPSVVLINEGTAAAAETLAAVLQRQGRATVVGSPSAGVGTVPRAFALDGGAVLLVAVAEMRAPDGAVIGRVVPDIDAADPRTLAGDASGRDPALAAAVVAVRAMALVMPPAAGAITAVRAPPALALALHLPPADEVTALGFQSILLGEMVAHDPLTWAARLGPVEDAGARIAAAREHGWQGGVTRYFGPPPGPTAPVLATTIDSYASEAGAAAAMATVESPTLRRSFLAPPRLGDVSEAYRGIWLNDGATVLVWRGGRVVVTVSYAAAPGSDVPAAMAAVARSIDRRLRANPPPVEQPLVILP